MPLPTVQRRYRELPFTLYTLYFIRRYRELPRRFALLYARLWHAIVLGDADAIKVYNYKHVHVHVYQY